MATINANVSFRDRVRFRSGLSTFIVVETGEMGVGAEGRSDDVTADYVVEVLVGPVCVGITQVAPSVSVSNWRHMNSDEDDNQWWGVRHPRWTVQQVAGGEQVKLSIDVHVMGEHAEVMALHYQVTIEAAEVVSPA